MRGLTWERLLGHSALGLGLLLLAVALAFVLDRRAPGMAGNLAEVRRGFGLIWRLVDDPARPIMGVPRYLVISVAVVLGLIGVAALLQ